MAPNFHVQNTQLSIPSVHPKDDIFIIFSILSSAMAIDLLPFLVDYFWSRFYMRNLLYSLRLVSEFWVGT